MGRGKQIVVLTIILLMIVGCVYVGVQIKNRPEPVIEETVYHGSFKETAISLPVLNENNGEEFLQMVRGLNGEVELYTVLYDETKETVRGYNKYVLNNDLKWEPSEADWLALEFFADTTQVIRLIAYADTGSMYFVLHDLAAELPQCDNVYRVGTDLSVERVNVRGLYKTDAEERPIQIRKMLISGNTICITDSLMNSYAYSLANGELYAQGANGALQSLTADSDNLYLLSDNYTSVIPYSLKDGSQQKELEFKNNSVLPSELESEYDIADYMLTYSDNTLSLSCQAGIFTYDVLNNTWDKVMDGMDCIFGKPSVVQHDFIISNNRYFAYSTGAQGNYHCTMYSERTQEEDKQLHRTDFVISSYRRSAIITEAAVAFQQKNPSLHVIYQVALEENPKMTVEGYRTQILADLQSKKAADVLVCDDLDYKMLMSNGYFENISDLMKPMYTSAKLYGNITNAMAMTKVFVTPAKFDALLFRGSSDTLKALSSLTELGEASAKKGAALINQLDRDDLAELLSCFYQDEFVIDEKIDRDALIAGLENFRTSVSTAEETDSFIEKIGSKDELIAFLHSLKDTSDSYTAAKGRFIPRSIVGINSNSSALKTAKDFISMLYSDAVQSTDVGLGIAMRNTVTGQWIDNPFAETEINEFTAMLRSLNFVFVKEDELCNSVNDVLDGLLAGEITAEEAADQIIK